MKAVKKWTLIEIILYHILQVPPTNKISETFAQLSNIVLTIDKFYFEKNKSKVVFDILNLYRGLLLFSVRKVEEL